MHMEPPWAEEIVRNGVELENRIYSCDQTKFLHVAGQVYESAISMHVTYTFISLFILLRHSEASPNHIDPFLSPHSVLPEVSLIQKFAQIQGNFPLYPAVSPTPLQGVTPLSV